MLWSLSATLGVGFLYYGFALIGVHFLSLPSGIVVFWPPNAVVLATFLTLPFRYWPGLAIIVVMAEVLADYSSFPVHAAVLFGLINVAECALAATIIKRFGANARVQPDWGEPLPFIPMFFWNPPRSSHSGDSGGLATRPDSSH